MVELAEDEVVNFAKVWAAVFVSLSYCYTIGKVTPKGFPRLLAILPIVVLFLALPLNLTSFHLGGMTSFFIAWLANFKLLLFAFGKGPLSSNPSISFPSFLALACLPIKIKDDPSPKNSTKSQTNQNPDQNIQNNSYPSHQNPPNSSKSPYNNLIKHDSPLKNSTKSQTNQDPDQKIQNNSYPSPQKPPNSSKSPFNYLIKVALLLLLIHTLSNYSDNIHPNIIWLIFFFQIYFTLEITLAILKFGAKFLVGFELEPQFNEPYLSTSLQDFWGRRWNLMASRILKPTVYLPTLDLSTKVVGRKWAPLPATMATFVVSAIMHELIFYYLGHLNPTFEVTWFFLLHGFCLCVEIVVKKKVGVAGKWHVPRWFSGPVTVVFVVATGFWLFLPPLVRAGLDTRPFQEYAAFGAFVRRVMRALTPSIS